MLILSQESSNINMLVQGIDVYKRQSYWLINQLVRKKQIPYCKVGGKYLFRVQALDEYLKNMELQSMN